MDKFRRLLTHRWVQIALISVFGTGLLGIGVAWKLGVDMATLREGWQHLNDYLVEHPWALIAALVILPGLLIPASPLLFTAGVVWRDQPYMAVGLGILGISLNLTWTYWLAAGPARRWVEKLLVATETEVPELPRGDHLRLILILRLTPGIPFFMQNYLLGFLRAPFRLYLPISILCNGLIATGFVLSGVGLADGNLKPAITGVSLIVLGFMLTQWIRKWLAMRRLKLEK